MLQVGNTMDDYLRKNQKFGAINVKELAHKFTCESVAEAAIGFHVNAINDTKCVFRRLLKEMFADDTLTGTIKITMLTLLPNFCRIFGIKHVSLHISFRRLTFL